MLKRMISFALVFLMTATVFPGCLSIGSAEEELMYSVVDAMDQITSFDASATFELSARIGTSSESSGHVASIGSDIAISSCLDPLSYHSEYYSQIVVDGVRTREDQEFYAVPDNDGYLLYEADLENDDWSIKTLSREEILALPLHTGMIQDWEKFLSYFEVESDDETLDGIDVCYLIGEVPTDYIQEVIGEDIFGSWLYSMEKLLNDTVSCSLYIELETFLPVQIIFDFTEAFTVSDMIIENGIITASYSNWNRNSEITVPKKVSIIATDDEAEFYLSYFAWDLFLPYITASENSGTQSSSSSFTSSWQTFEMRVDGYMLKLPLEYKKLNDLGYIVDDDYSSIILEPYSKAENVPVFKNKDIIHCTFYNPDVNPLPITSCTIGAVDVIASDIVQNGVNIYLPGELTLGISKEALLSAYGDPDQTSTGFAADTYVWNGDTADQSFYAEVSTVTGQLVRFKLSNVPLLEKPEPTEPTPDETEAETEATE